MKNIKLFFGVALLATVLFSACKPKDPIDDTTPAKIGVKINGVVWAPYNVGATGKFVSKPEDYGGLYQWNRKDTANFLLEDDYFASAFSTANSWLPANNPCPKGWRVPMREELQSLEDAGAGEWTTLNGINGRKFGSGNSTIFLPAAGYRGYSNGTLYTVGTNGYYWSSTEHFSNSDAYFLGFHSDNAEIYRDYDYKCYGLSVRCVAE